MKVIEIERAGDALRFIVAPPSPPSLAIYVVATVYEWDNVPAQFAVERVARFTR